MQTVKCLVCEKELEYDEHELVGDGGFMFIEFHYGSTLDQCKGFARSFPKDGKPLTKILACDEIEAYICDACFEKKHHLCKGFKVKKVTTRELVIGSGELDYERSHEPFE